LDSRRGVLLASNYEYPGRYARWDIGFVDPPLMLTAKGLELTVSALNLRGRVLLPAVADAVSRLTCVSGIRNDGERFIVEIVPCVGTFPEEMRSRLPSVFSPLRAVVDLFGSPEDPYLGLYGAFGYDLAFQFEPIRLRQERSRSSRDLVLYLPDRLVVVDRRCDEAVQYDYEFENGGLTTCGLPHDGSTDEYAGSNSVERTCDHEPGEYAHCVRTALERFRRGDLFEVVPGQTFFEPCPARPAEVFRRLRERNPAPYSFLINPGESEYLVGASPEMYVRVRGRRVETCPIAGTVPRGADVMGDARQILQLLNSKKDESELTMCTDVDRNDKSRICEPGSVKVLARRQIEMYSRLIHTVDHVEGYLREPFDALDAFLAHAWAVTVTGAPKTWAMQFIEEVEKSPRGWYGGAVGQIGFDGNLNTGLTLRTIHIRNGVAAVRAGATLLCDSDPEEEEIETRVKASALIDAVRRRTSAVESSVGRTQRSDPARRILLIDHQDSFVHTLADYLRQTGAEVMTLRAGFPLSDLDAFRPDLAVLSPGPGSPSDFDVAGSIKECVSRKLPVFGVCLGLQGLVEYFGGKLGQLAHPVHGKASRIRVLGGRIFEGLPAEFTAGRYHSLYGVRETLPSALRLTAESDDGVVMGVEHTQLPLAAVQFHPESILTLDGEAGLKLIFNVTSALRW
jgi:anthranilate synthase